LGGLVTTLAGGVTKTRLSSWVPLGLALASAAVALAVLGFCGVVVTKVGMVSVEALSGACQLVKGPLVLMILLLFRK
jgi:Mg2+/Co2+ transporter CorB